MIPALDPHVGPFVLGLGALVALIFVARAVGTSDSPEAHRLWLFGLVVLPGVALAVGAGRAIEDAKTPAFCGSCHVMHPWRNDLDDLNSKTLASKHYQNRYILEDQCYTCHSDYTMFGPLEAKLSGVRHLWHFLTDRYERPIKIRKAYRIENCLHCHGEARVFREAHPDIADQLASGMSCLDCHAPVHPEQAKATP